MLEAIRKNLQEKSYIIYKGMHIENYEYLTPKEFAVLKENVEDPESIQTMDP